MVAKMLRRPDKTKEERKSVNCALRGRGQLRERLREAAATSGRSISEEIEQRLEQSFRQDDADSLLRALSRETVESIHRDLRTQLAIKIAAEIFRRNPQAQISGLLSLAKYLPEAQATRAKDVLEMTDDEAEFVAEAEAPEQTGPTPPTSKYSPISRSHSVPFSGSVPQQARRRTPANSQRPTRERRPP